jgi:uncharacterized protein (DUF2147 family)
MRFHFSILASALLIGLAASPASAASLKGYWRMDSPLEGMQAVVEVYECMGGKALCGKVAAVVGPDIDRRSMLNQELLRDMKKQRDGSYKGKLKMPVGPLPALNTTVQPKGRDHLSFKACFLGQCRSGTMSRLF